MHSLTFKPTQYVAGEYIPITPKVIINGKEAIHFTCLFIENNSGILPSKAILRLMPELIPKSSGDYTAIGESESPVTLNKISRDFNPMFGSRVVITANDTVLFAGHMLRKEDSGSSDTVLWTAFDDREMITKIPIRGAVVLDEYKTEGLYKAKFLSRYNAQCNPSGLWNCTGYEVNISGHPLNGQIVPVFSSRAYIRQNYISPDAVFNEDLKVGEITAWTPRRMLQYIWFVLHIGVASSGAVGDPNEDATPDIDGLQRQNWRSLRNYPRVSGVEASNSASSRFWDWKYSEITGMNGSEPSSEIDPLDRKLPTIDFQGKAALQAIDDILVSAGTHSFKVGYVKGADENEYKSTLEFFPIGFTAANGEKSTFSKIPLVRSGNASDVPNANTAFDFQLSEDATYTKTAVLVEGDIVRVETEVSKDIGLVPAWGDKEEEAFLRIIWGSDNPLVDIDTIKFAKYPPQQSIDNKTIQPFSKWVLADGGEGRQFAYARWPEAVKLARSIFPRVFRAWRIDSESTEVINALKGFNNQYENTTAYPIGKSNRQILDNQLQFQLSDLGGGAGTENWLEQKFPIRVQVQNGSVWQDAEYTTAQNLGEGVFLIDMAENYNGKLNCIYSGNMFASGNKVPVDTLNVAVKEVKMNLAFPMDHKTKGYAKTNQATNRDINEINNIYLRDTGDDGYIQYIDSPIGYREEHQINSTPTPNSKMLSGTELIDVPLNRLLPPGSEAENAQYAAQRRLYTTQRIDRRSSWKMIGIRPEWAVGLFVEGIDLIKYENGLISSEGEESYPINAPILSIVHDFQNQVTNINGLIGESI